ncbi:MAG: isocitrate dehydrogenase (NADP(+)) [bacterium]
MISFDKLTLPSRGEKIKEADGRLEVPDLPIIPVIEGDGIGPDIWQATKKVVDAAVKIAYQGQREIVWFEIYAGEKAYQEYNNYLPQDTLKAIEHFLVALKGPLTTPVGGGFRSLNVTLRQYFDLYACLRPIKYIKGVPSPIKHPEQTDLVIFRENTEDVYAGIEWPQGTVEANEIISFLRERFGVEIRKDSGIGIKPISLIGSKRLVRMAIKYALEHNRQRVTLVHKGNIMKFTEGAFRDWGYELAKEEFSGQIVTEEEVGNSSLPSGKVLINDRIADNMFAQILTRTNEYDVIATTNLNGDYLSDAAAAQVGGLGLAPSANLGDRIAIFEATHGSAPKYAGRDMANPSSLILSACLMLEHIGWSEAGKLVEGTLERAIQAGQVTYDLARSIEGATKLSTSDFASAVVDKM